MKTNYEVRYASNPTDAKQYDTSRLRQDFLIEKLFAADEVLLNSSLSIGLAIGCWPLAFGF